MKRSWRRPVRPTEIARGEPSLTDGMKLDHVYLLARSVYRIDDAPSFDVDLQQRQFHRAPERARRRDRRHGLGDLPHRQADFLPRLIRNRLEVDIEVH